ncbi:MAG: PilN domain-containing protein [Solirubrobacteraceae bacterium]
MRAVNLIPVDARAGGGISGGRSGGAVYALLGGLAALVLMVLVWTTVHGRVGDQRAELAGIEQETAQLQARAGAGQAPGAVQQERAARTQTVEALIASRRDWAATLDAISRAMPSDTTLTTLNATSVPPAAPPTPTPTTGAAGPTVELGGCAPTQRAVAKLMPRLKTVPDVVDVLLVSSSSVAASTNSADSPQACAGTTFSMTVVLEGLAAPATTPAVATPTAATTQPATATTAVPATPDPGTGGTQ